MDTNRNVRIRDGIHRIYPADRRPVCALARPFRCREKFIVVHLDLVGGEPGAWIYLISVSRTLMEAKQQIALVRACSSELARDDVEEFFDGLDVMPCGRWRRMSRDGEVASCRAHTPEFAGSIPAPATRR